METIGEELAWWEQGHAARSGRLVLQELRTRPINGKFEIITGAPV